MYQLPELLKFPKLLHAFSEVSDGNMSFRWGSRDEVENNRHAFLARIGLSPEVCISVGVHHGVSIGRAGAAERGQGMAHGDVREMPEALLTDAPETFLFLLTGDCLPLLFYDPGRRVAGLAHVSRHNTLLHMVRGVMAKMCEWYGTLPGDVAVGVGPGVREESYRFPAGMCAEFAPVWKNFMSAPDSLGCALNVPGWNVHQLFDAGVRRANIFVAPCDTLADRRFFSHARSRSTGEAEGRFATVVGLRNTYP